MGRWTAFLSRKGTPRTWIVRSHDISSFTYLRSLGTVFHNDYDNSYSDKEYKTVKKKILLFSSTSSPTFTTSNLFLGSHLIQVYWWCFNANLTGFGVTWDVHLSMFSWSILSTLATKVRRSDCSYTIVKEARWDQELTAEHSNVAYIFFKKWKIAESQ